MPTLDSCINGMFTAGAIPASAGPTPVSPSVPSLLDPETYDPDEVTYSHDFSKFYNSMFAHGRVR